MIMKEQNDFLKILSIALNGKIEKVEDWEDAPNKTLLVRQAIDHNIFPLIIDGLYLQAQSIGKSKGAAVLPDQLQELYRNEILRQAQKTADFILLYEYLADRGIHPLVMKGIICRNLYPNPEHRASADEDLLIAPSEFMRCHEALIEYGLEPVKEGQDLDKAYEVSYENKESHLYIELHKTPFEAGSRIFGNLNLLFEGVGKRSITERVYGTDFHTLEPTDHLLYLILHAFKHFLYSGFGIRQICDIVLYAEYNRDHINWDKIRRSLQSVRALDFTAAVFRIGDLYLIPKNHMSEYLQGWRTEEIDIQPLLSDILDGGVYGASSLTRLHTSNMTLHALENPGTEHLKAGKALLHTVFLPLSALENRFPYLKKSPFLLPVAWMQRISEYISELGDRRKEDDDMLESIRLGKERIRLLQRYHIIDDT